MIDFWNNILRYPRFFVSSLVGSLAVILTPFKSLFKIPEYRSLLFLGVFVLIIGINNIITKMSGL